MLIWITLIFSPPFRILLLHRRAQVFNLARGNIIQLPPHLYGTQKALKKAEWHRKPDCHLTNTERLRQVLNSPQYFAESRGSGFLPCRRHQGSRLQPPGGARAWDFSPTGGTGAWAFCPVGLKIFTGALFLAAPAAFKPWFRKGF